MNFEIKFDDMEIGVFGSITWMIHVYMTYYDSIMILR